MESTLKGDKVVETPSTRFLTTKESNVYADNVVKMVQSYRLPNNPAEVGSGPQSFAFLEILMRIVESDISAAEAAKVIPNELINFVHELEDVKDNFGRFLIRSGDSSLIVAARTGRIDAAITLIERGANLESRSKLGATALMAACIGGHDGMVSTLLTRGAFIDIQNMDGFSPLMLACMFGHISTVEVLLDSGARLDLLSAPGLSALHYAVDRGNMELSQLLLTRGASTRSCNSQGWTCLITAAFRGHCEIAAMLLSFGDNIESKTINGVTSLMFACSCGHISVAQFLINAGVLLEARDNQGSTALIVASEKGHTEILKLLLDNGAFLEARDMEGVSPLMAAGGNRGADVHARNNCGLTAFLWTAENGAVDTLSVLFERRSDANALSSLGLNALALACLNGHVSASLFLIERDFDPLLPVAVGTTDETMIGKTSLDLFGTSTTIEPPISAEMIQEGKNFLIEAFNRRKNWLRRKDFLMFLVGSKLIPLGDARFVHLVPREGESPISIPPIPIDTPQAKWAYLVSQVFCSGIIVELIVSFV